MPVHLYFLTNPQVPSGLGENGGSEVEELVDELVTVEVVEVVEVVAGTHLPAWQFGSTQNALPDPHLPAVEQQFPNDEPTQVTFVGD